MNNNMNYEALNASLKMMEKKAEMDFESAKAAGTLDARQEKLSELLRNHEVIVALAEAQTVEEAQAVFAANGLELSIEEVEKLGEQLGSIAGKLLKNGGELSEEDLEDVAGGFAAAASTGAAIGTAVCPGAGTAVGTILGTAVGVIGVKAVTGIWDAYGDKITEFVTDKLIDLGKKGAKKAWGWIKSWF